MITEWALFTGKVLTFIVLAGFWLFLLCVVCYGVGKFVIGICGMIIDIINVVRSRRE